MILHLHYRQEASQLQFQNVQNELRMSQYITDWLQENLPVVSYESIGMFQCIYGQYIANCQRMMKQEAELNNHTK